MAFAGYCKTKRPLSETEFIGPNSEIAAKIHSHVLRQLLGALTGKKC